MKSPKSWLFFIFLCAISFVAFLWLKEGTDDRLFSAALSLKERLADSRNNPTKAVPPPEKTLIDPQSDTSPNYHSSRPVSTNPLSGDHTYIDSEACHRPVTKPRSDVDNKVLYKWVDEHGQTHLSDQQPQGYIASVLDAGGNTKDFTYNIIPEGVSVPIDFPGHLSAGSKRIYDVWHFFIGEENLRQSKINLKLIGGPERFDNYYHSTFPGKLPVNGFYSISNNIAVVKFDPERLDKTLATTFHETSHLITASHIGPTSPWLTEGLAEYFETMKVEAQAGEIYPNPQHLKLLKSAQLPSLINFLSIDRPEWYSHQRDRNYAMAWALIYFLMDGAPGIYALQQTIKDAHANFCISFSLIGALDSAYPGGIRRLEADWNSWLSAGDFKVHQT